MKMMSFTRRACVLFLAFAASPTLTFAQAVKAEKTNAAPAIKVSADHADAQYHVGQTATFTIEVSDDGKPWDKGPVSCVLSKDGWKPQPAQAVPVKDGRATISGSLAEPGFLQLHVSSGKTTVLAGVGFDPLQIKPSLPPPDDFDAFWTAQKEALARIPLKSQLTPVKSPNAEVDAFDLQVDCLGKPVSGYFGKPKTSKPKSLPAILFVHGAGVRSSVLGSTHWAAREGGMLALDINAHGIPNGQPDSFYDDLSRGELKDYRTAGRTSRDEIYFRGMFLRLIRAIDFLTAQPEWDGKTLIVYGSSQGGFQAFVAAGLDPRVTFFCAGVPAGCDHTGVVVDRINGWPKFVSVDANGKYDPAAVEAARYYDCVNFATRAKCRGAAVTVGYIDVTCPPTSVYAAYNALTIPKTIHYDINAGHTSTPAGGKFLQDAAIKHVREMKQ